MKRYAALFLLLPAIAVLSSNFTRNTPTQSGAAYLMGYAVGDQAEDFRLKNIDGRMVSLSDYPDAAGYIVLFTCNHCPYAQLYEDRIISIHRRFAPLGYPVVAINPNDPELMPEDSFDEMKKRAKQKNFPFPYLMDEHQDVYPRFGADRTPLVYLLDSTLHVRYIGTIDDNAESPGNVKKKYLENALHAVMRGENPNPSTTRAVGCMIRKKNG